MPKYVLMENVVDILKFVDGFLGKYALSRLVAIKYQAKLRSVPNFRTQINCLSSSVTNFIFKTKTNYKVHKFCMVNVQRLPKSRTIMLLVSWAPMAGNLPFVIATKNGKYKESNGLYPRNVLRWCDGGWTM